MHVRLSPCFIAIVGMFLSARGVGVCDSLPNGMSESAPQTTCPRFLVGSDQSVLPELSESSKISPKDWNLALSMAANYAKGLGAYYTDSHAGADFELRLALSVSQNIALRFCYSRSGIAYSDSLSWDEVGNSVEAEPDFDVTSVTAGMQWYRWVDRLRQAGPIIYFSLDAGVARHSLTVTETFISYLPDSQPVVSSYSMTDNRPTLRTGMGTLFPMGNRLSFDMNMGLDLIWTKTGGPDDPRRAIYGIKGFILHGAIGLNLNI